MEGVGDQELQHGERRGHPSVGLRRASVAAVAVRGCRRGTLADQERFTGKFIDLALGGVVEGTWLHQWGRTSGLSQCWELESTRNGRTRIRNVLADKYIDLVGMNTSNGAQAQIWNYVSGGNQEWNLVRVDPDTAQTNARAEEKRDPEPTPSQRKHQNDLVRKLNNAGKGRAARK